MAGKHNAKLLDGRKRHAIITALANGEAKRSIVRRLRVGNHTVDAVAEQEWQQVAARRKRIAAIAERNAMIAAEKIQQKLLSGDVPLNMLVPTFGVSADKVALLRPAQPIQLEHTHLHAHSHRHFDEYNKLLDALPADEPVIQAGLTNGNGKGNETAQAMDLQSQRENTKNG